MKVLPRIMASTGKTRNVEEDSKSSTDSTHVVCCCKCKENATEPIDYVHIDSLTIHGLPRAITSSSWVARIFWMSLFLTGTTIFIFFSHGAISTYLRHDTYRSVTMVSGHEVNFPSVTICNMRKIRREQEVKVMDGNVTTTHNMLNNFLKNNSKVYRDGPASFDEFAEGFSNIINAIGICLFGGTSPLVSKCDTSSFKTVSLMPGCITFNYDGKLSQTDVGRDFGLNMIIYLESEDLADTPESMEMGSGPDDIAIIIHEPFEFPSTNENNLFLDAGVHAKIAIRKRISKLLPSPYPSQCIKAPLSEPQYNLFPGNYNQKYCSRSCMLYKTYLECGDLPEYDRAVFTFDNLPRVNTTNLDKQCVIQNMIKYSRNSTTCTCPQSCDLANFEVSSLTTSIWPGAEKNQIIAEYMSKVLGKTINSSDIENDFTYLSVYFGDLYYISEEEVATYNINSLLSDLGGQAGLYCGASFFSIIELVIVLILYIMSRIKACIVRTKHSKVERP